MCMQSNGRSTGHASRLADELERELVMKCDLPGQPGDRLVRQALAHASQEVCILCIGPGMLLHLLPAATLQHCGVDSCLPGLLAA